MSLLARNQPILEEKGKATELRNQLYSAHCLDGPVVPGASVTRMTGVIVAFIGRIRFRP